MTLFYYIKWKNLFSDFYEKKFLKFFICWAIISCFSYVHLGYMTKKIFRFFCPIYKGNKNCSSGLIYEPISEIF